MPPPIVPAPITPTRLMSRGLVSSGKPSIFAALRSAKKMYCCAADWVPIISSMNSSRSKATPSAIGLGASPPRRRRCWHQARRSRGTAGIRLLEAASISRIDVAEHFCVRAVGSGRVGDLLRAKATAWRRGCPHPRVRRPGPVPSPPWRRDRLAERGHLAARPRPRRRAAGAACRRRRAAGRASLRARRASPRARRRGNGRRARSRSPPPSAVPWIAATTGLVATLDAVDHRGRSGPRIGLPNSVMSAPAKKVLAVATHHHRLDAIVGECRGEWSARPWRTCQLERVDRRIVDDDDGDLAILLHRDGNGGVFGHFRLLQSQTRSCRAKSRHPDGMRRRWASRLRSMRTERGFSLQKGFHFQSSIAAWTSVLTSRRTG